MKKLSLFILLISLLCCVALFAACNTETQTADPCAGGHTVVTDEAIAPDCVTKGLTSGSHCSVCNKVITTQTDVDALGHTPGEPVVQIAPSCTAKGVQHTTCTVCGILEVQTLEATGHDFSAWTTTKTATCTQKGQETRTCTVCGLVETRETKTIPHMRGGEVIDLQPTCTSLGSKHYSCVVCKNIVSVQSIAALGHDYETFTLTTAPSCTAPGKESSTCTKCGDVLSRDVAMLDHTKSAWLTDIAATCASPGSKHVECTDCGQVLETATIAKTRHSYGAWLTTTPATCTTPGVRTRACSRCPAAETETLARISHTLTDWVTDVAPGCESVGYRHKSCTDCGNILELEEMASLGHLNDDWTVLIAATCISAGEEGRGCTRCGEIERRTIAPSAHTEGEWITDVAPTCSSLGSRHSVCSLCNATLSTETIAKLPHTEGPFVLSVAPTRTQAGSSTVYCSICGDTVKTVSNRLVNGLVAVDQTTSVNLSVYTLVYADALASNSVVMEQINRLVASVKSITGFTCTALPDSRASAASAQGKEILVGLTSREESANAYATLRGRAMAVRTQGNKIVIAASDDTAMIASIAYFIQSTLRTATSPNVAMCADASALNMPSLTLLHAGESNYKFVMDANVDNDPQHMYVGDSWSISNQGYAGDSRDYPAFLIEDLISKLSVKTGVPVSSFPRITDTTTTYVNGLELLFGEIDRAESIDFRKTLDANEYGFLITDSKIVITAHTDLGLERAANAFYAFYAKLLSINGGILPQGYSETGAITDQGWIMSFPRPSGENISICNAQNNNDKSLQIIYTGSGVNASAYLAYCQKLVSSGYSLVTESSAALQSASNSYFRVYKNNTTSHVLYVAYNAFSYEDNYKNSATTKTDHVQSSTPNSTTVYYPMLDYQQCIRVVSAPLGTAYLPTAELLSDTYNRATQKVCESSITTVRLYGNAVGMSYIIQLEDGSFMIIDGGSNVNNDATVLYATLVELHRKAYGSAPTTANPIRITAWYITHSHGDHYGVTSTFLKTYGKTGLVTMKYLVGNYPEFSTIYAVGSDTTAMGSGTIATMQSYVTNGFTYVKVHTGMTLYFANLKMEVLMTYEDHAPFRITNSNDTNTVSKLTIRSANKDTTWMLLGDSCIYQSRWLSAMWGGSYNSSTQLYDGSYMKADMVQLAHHGNIGCEIALYKTIQPEVVWFPHQSYTYNGYTQDSQAIWTDTVDRYVVKTLSTVKYVIVSGWYNNSSTFTNYHDSITLQFTADGPNYNNFWGVKYRATGSAVVSSISFNTKASGRHITYVNTSPVIKK